MPPAHAAKHGKPGINTNASLAAKSMDDSSAQSSLPTTRPLHSNVLLGWRDRRPTAKVVGYGLTGRKVSAGCSICQAVHAVCFATAFSSCQPRSRCRHPAALATLLALSRTGIHDCWLHIHTTRYSFVVPCHAPLPQVSMVRSAAAGITASTMLPWVAPEVLRTPELVTGKVRSSLVAGGGNDG